MPTYHDLTTAITEKTTVFPGDPLFQKEQLNVISSTCNFSSSKITMGNHTGTHVDFPGHVVRNGKLSSDYAVDQLIGDGLIIEVPNEVDAISRSFVESQPILPGDFVFFKTRNSNISKHTQFSEQFVYIEPEAAKALLEKQVKIVGIDYLSVDAYDRDELPVHHLLLENNVLIVENLALSGVDPGRCRLFIMPINIPNMDGLPARVVMLKY